MPNQPTRVVLLPAPNDAREQYKIRAVRFRVPNSVVVTLFTTPITVVSGKPGYTPIPITMVINKAAGAYTLNGATKFQCVNPLQGGNLIAIATTGFADQAAALAAIGFGPGAAGSQMFAELTPWAGASGTLTFSTTIANMSGGGGGDLDVTLYWRYWKMTF